MILEEDAGLWLGAFFQKQASNYHHARKWVKDQEAVLAPQLFSNGYGKLESFLAAKGWDVSLPHAQLFIASVLIF